MFTFVANFWQSDERLASAPNTDRLTSTDLDSIVNWFDLYWLNVLLMGLLHPDRLSLIVSGSVRAPLVDECVYVGIYCAQFNYRQLMHFLLVIRRRINKLLCWGERMRGRGEKEWERVREKERHLRSDRNARVFSSFFFSIFFDIFLSRIQNLSLGCLCLRYDLGLKFYFLCNIRWLLFRLLSLTLFHFEIWRMSYSCFMLWIYHRLWSRQKLCQSTRVRSVEQ